MVVARNPRVDTLITLSGPRFVITVAEHCTATIKSFIYTVQQRQMESVMTNRLLERVSDWILGPLARATLLTADAEARLVGFERRCGDLPVETAEQAPSAASKSLSEAEALVARRSADY